MQINYPHVKIRRINGLLGFSRQAYYQYWRNYSKGAERDQEVIQLIELIRKDHPRIGGRKLYVLLKEELCRRRIKIGRDAFFDLLSANNMLVKKRKRRIKTTFSKHRFRKYPNIVKNLIIDRPNQVWVSDITYWSTEIGPLYISLVTDAYSRLIVGFDVASTLEAINSLYALQMALATISKELGKYLIHHSDRGIKYCCTDYIQMLQSYHIKISMTENSDPLENPIAERVNGILKEEYLCFAKVSNLPQAYQVVQDAVALYNFKRPHLSCNMLVPTEAHQTQGGLRRKWKSYYSAKEDPG